MMKVWAQTEFLDQIVDNTQTPSKLTSFQDIFNMGANVMVGIAIAISGIGIILSGIKYITSKGDAKAVETAGKSLTYSVVAFILAIGAYTLVRIIMGTLGITTK